MTMKRQPAVRRVVLTAITLALSTLLLWGCVETASKPAERVRYGVLYRPGGPIVLVPDESRLPESAGIADTTTVPEEASEILESLSRTRGEEIPVPSFPASPYVAFSLKVAQKMIDSISAGEDYRKKHPDVFYLGGITRIKGLVYDREQKDLILVGSRLPDEPPLTLDDLVVALRARFVDVKWPLVSIDPTPETKQTQMQHVRYEGGIDGTAFGLDMFDADLRLKMIGMGLLPSGVDGLTSQWDRSVDEIKAGQGTGEFEISSRFWFYPVIPLVTVREDVAAMEGLKVAVFTEVLSARINGQEMKDYKDKIGDEFAQEVSRRYGELGKHHRSMARLRGLNELVALTRAMEDMDEKPDISCWVREYKLSELSTPKEQRVLRREWEYQLPIPMEVVRGQLGVSGGVQLTAIALRLEAGDVSALRDAVIGTRPNADTLMWTFVVSGWVIPTSPGMLAGKEELAALFAQALFLQQQERYNDAIALYGRIVSADPGDAEVYFNRGVAYAAKGEYDKAVEDFNKAIQISSDYAEAYNNRGASFWSRGEYGRAIEDFNKAIELKPDCAQAYHNRGLAFCCKGQYDRAIEDLSWAIQLKPDHPETHYNRGVAYGAKKELDRAIEDYNKAIQLKPDYAEAYNNRSASYSVKGEYDRAIEDSGKAIQLKPDYAEPYCNRANVYAVKGEYDRAIEDYNKAIQLKADFVEAYSGRGNTFGRNGQYDRAIEDSAAALRLEPDLAEAHFTRGSAYAAKKELDRAIEDLNKAIQLKPDLVEAHYNRAVAYQDKGEYERAISDFDKVIQLKPDWAQAYFSKAQACEKAARIREAVEEYRRFIVAAPIQFASHVRYAKQRVRELERR
jgi:tetratricopeptide (TPR) repeat protein